MIYLKNSLEEQEVYIPRQDQGGEYVSPCKKCYGEGYEQGYADGSNIKLEQGDIVVTADTMTVLPSSGYSGFESVDIDATEYGQDKYDEGYGDGNSDGYASGEAAQKAKLTSTAFTQNGVYNREDGWNEVEVIVADIPARVQEKTIVVTAATETVYPDSGYEGISSAYVDATAYGQSQYQSGTTHGEEVQKAKLTSTAFTQNGVYNRTDGWDEVEVIVPQSGSPCNLESGVTFPLNSGFTQTTVTPSSGYDGISDITIYDNGYGQERYDGGYTAGRASVSLESKTETITADTQTIYPSSGYDGMSSVDIDASSLCSDYYGSGWTEGYNEGQADCPSCNLQDKSVVMTAQTETFYPDQMAVADVPVIGIEIPSWDEKYCIDTNINPTSSMTVRIKYQGRGVYTDRLIGTYPNFLGVPDDDHDYRTFDAQGWVDFDILNGRFENLHTILTNSGDGYDITMSADGVYDNINEEWIVQGDSRYYEPDTGYTICVDVGTVFVKEVIIEDNDTELFHGTPSVESGEAGLYDSVSDSFFGIYSGADVPLVLYADYDGISEISVDATTLCGEYYNSGYTDGFSSGAVGGYNLTNFIVYDTIDHRQHPNENPSASNPNGAVSFSGDVSMGNHRKLVFDDYITSVYDSGFIFGERGHLNTGCVLSYVEIPYGITSIGRITHMADNLKHITLPITLETIGESSFWFCPSLEELYIPDSVRTIGAFAFGKCGSLRYLYIGKSVETIGQSAFAFTCIKDLVIPDSTTSIGRSAFKGCGVLSAITIGYNVSSIGYHAFDYSQDCSGCSCGSGYMITDIFVSNPTPPVLENDPNYSGSQTYFTNASPNGGTIWYTGNGWNWWSAEANYTNDWLPHFPAGWTVALLQ